MLFKVLAEASPAARDAAIGEGDDTQRVAAALVEALRRCVASPAARATLLGLATSAGSGDAMGDGDPLKQLGLLFQADEST